MTPLEALRKMDQEVEPGPWSPRDVIWLMRALDVEFVVASRNLMPDLLNVAEAAALVLPKVKWITGPEMEKLRAALAPLLEETEVSENRTEREESS